MVKKAIVTACAVTLGIALVAVTAVLTAIAGAASLGLTGAVLAGLAWILGLIGVPTAKAVVLWFAAAGAVVGVLRALLIGLGAAAE